jgi:hypothetical protein
MRALGDHSVSHCGSVLVIINASTLSEDKAGFKAVGHNLAESDLNELALAEVRGQQNDVIERGNDVGHEIGKAVEMHEFLRLPFFLHGTEIKSFKHDAPPKFIPGEDTVCARAGNKKPASPASGERVLSLGHFVAASFGDRILARGEWHLGCPSQVAGPCVRGPLLMPKVFYA